MILSGGFPSCNQSSLQQVREYGRRTELGPSKQDYTVRDNWTDGTEIIYSGIMQPAVSRIGISGFVATIRITSDTYRRVTKEE